jgi:hypothetical protein
VAGGTSLRIVELNPRIAREGQEGNLFAVVEPDDVVVLAE